MSNHDPYGQAPYGQTPGHQDPYGQQPAQQPTQPYGTQYGAPQYGSQQFGAQQFGGPQYGMTQLPPPPHPRATTAMVLGLVGLVGGLTCGLGFLLSPFAWAIGSRTVKEIDASKGQLAGRDQANTGRITGIVGTVLLVLAIVAFIAMVVFFVATTEVSSSTVTRESYDL
ncbi:DUF4190 domain-containing protein [Nocardioides yefusunii]|uniref:DUF4190 domain-containing protein n=1 Tax=Nocardioides yefusunii TaxID=2500546 RepID=A0ABW1QX10_9ACTN|nr:DUF4190 domain-containing protein [Nocardioides yefusunii]